MKDKDFLELTKDIANKKVRIITDNPKPLLGGGKYEGFCKEVNSEVEPFYITIVTGNNSKSFLSAKISKIELIKD